ncbi:Cupin domain protein [Aquimixticola soesokkakensis]|uniref:Cupin domain protein n=1 Tax=Aquimixticola soesokkakensis TaxID=1519096 RepID=A0A1Y5SHD7_9RHOB|nr:cupin domain-containing protein [Aquimixticola soesokkakensis]SLN40882.1 Cupin domain protein [Aquimixticola soesokkakensis]
MGETYLLKAAEIGAQAGTDKTHFLNTNAQRRNLSLGDLTGLTGIGVHLIEVAPGCETTEHHVHFYEDEAVYVLSGTATARIGAQNHAIAAGDFIGYRKGGLAHSIQNTGDEVLRCLVVGERAAHDVADYPDQGKRIYRNAGQPWDLVAQGDITQLGGAVGKK